MDDIMLKLCGMTQVEQVNQLVDMKIDAIGVILKADSPRCISIDKAKIIRQAIPKSTIMVGVFVNATAQTMNQLAKSVGLDMLQLHGDESLKTAEELKYPFIRAISTRSTEYITQQIQIFSNAKAYLLDTYVKGIRGGTGQTFHADLWPKNTSCLIASGGIGPNNILRIAQQLTPAAIDINSQVEISPGVKDMDKVQQCVQLLRHDTNEA